MPTEKHLKKLKEQFLGDETRNISIDPHLKHQVDPTPPSDPGQLSEKAAKTFWTVAALAGISGVILAGYYGLQAYDRTQIDHPTSGSAQEFFTEDGLPLGFLVASPDLPPNQLIYTTGSESLLDEVWNACNTTFPNIYTRNDCVDTMAAMDGAGMFTLPENGPQAVLGINPDNTLQMGNSTISNAEFVQFLRSAGYKDRLTKKELVKFLTNAGIGASILATVWGSIYLGRKLSKRKQAKQVVNDLMDSKKGAPATANKRSKHPNNFNINDIPANLSHALKVMTEKHGSGSAQVQSILKDIAEYQQKNRNGK